ncbi:neuropeptides capa receptor-like [Amphiura filiformis]|uniref:neuropeptides capa receptor-like n=1 Tax=Amphiura filiformis TaxID=82378 RepID=UPI003B21A2DF
MAETCTVNNTITLTYNETLGNIYSRRDVIFVIIVIPIIALFGLVTNSSFLFVLYRIDSMRTVTNFYLGNLAVADACALIFITSKHVWTYMVNSTIQKGIPWKSPIGCLLLYLSYVVYYTSVFIITLVSIERYFATCHPLRHRLLNKKTRAVKLVITTWVVSFGLASFAALPTSTYQLCYNYILTEKTFPKEDAIIVYECKRACANCFLILLIIDMVQFVIACLLNSILYSLIVLKVNKRSIGESIANNNVRNSVIRMVIANSVVFFLCLFPFQIVNVRNLILSFDGYSFISAENLSLIEWIGRATLLLNSSVNPVVYSMTNPRYRKAFLEAFNLRHDDN